jgi:hypothetical protein
VTCVRRETLTIAGFALEGNDWDGLYMGRRKGKDLVYAGKVDHGFDAESAKMLRARLTALVRKTQPCTKRIAHRGVWVEPELLAEIEYRAKSAEGKLRHRSIVAYEKTYEVHALRRCGWVCESHPNRPWQGEHACDCGGAGMPCPWCNRASDGEAPRMPEGFKTDFNKDGWRN